MTGAITPRAPYLTRTWAGILLGGSLVAVLAACSASWTARGSSSSSVSSGSSSVTSTSSATGGGTSRAVSLVSCTDTSCSVTLGGEGSEVGVLDTQIAFVGIRDRQATVRVGGRTVSCTEGQTVTADGLTLRCTSITEDTVSFTGSRE